MSVGRTVHLIALAAGMALRPSAAMGQVIQGHLIDDSRLPIAGGSLLLLDSADTAVASTISGDSGQFMFSPRPGRYRIRAERIGYRTVTSAPVDLRAGGTQHIEFFLSVDAVPMDPLRIIAPPKLPFLENMGFYKRQRAEGGRFFTREDFESRRPRFPSDILRTVPGVQLIPSSHGNTIGFSRTLGSSFIGCTIAIWVDGLRMYGERSIDFLQTDEIEALEVYRGVSQLPVQYSGSESTCGAVLVWTRRGRSP